MSSPLRAATVASSDSRRYAEVRLGDGLTLLQLLDDRLCRVDRDREADVLRILRAGGVDADDLAVERQQWTAGVAGVDGRVGLHEVCQVLAVVGVDRPVERRHDAFGRRRTAGQVERVADRHDRFADPQIRRRTERQRGEAGLVDLDHGEIVGAIDTEHLRGGGRAVGELDVDVGRVGDDVGVGGDLAVAADHEARAGSLAPLSSTLMLTTPGSALLINAETSALTASDGASRGRVEAADRCNRSARRLRIPARDRACRRATGDSNYGERSQREPPARWSHTCHFRGRLADFVNGG